MLLRNKFIIEYDIDVGKVHSSHVLKRAERSQISDILRLLFSVYSLKDTDILRYGVTLDNSLRKLMQN